MEHFLRMYSQSVLLAYSHIQDVFVLCEVAKMILDDGGKGSPLGPLSAICSVGLRMGRGWLTLTSTWEGSRWVSDVDMGPHMTRVSLNGRAGDRSA